MTAISHSLAIICLTEILRGREEEKKKREWRSICLSLCSTVIKPGSFLQVKQKFPRPLLT
jgi:hypothetical protein